MKTAMKDLGVFKHRRDAQAFADAYVRECGVDPLVRMELAPGVEWLNEWPRRPALSNSAWSTTLAAVALAAACGSDADYRPDGGPHLFRADGVHMDARAPTTHPDSLPDASLVVQCDRYREIAVGVYAWEDSLDTRPATIAVGEWEGYGRTSFRMTSLYELVKGVDAGTATDSEFAAAMRAAELTMTSEFDVPRTVLGLMLRADRMRLWWTGAPAKDGQLPTMDFDLRDLARFVELLPCAADAVG